MRKTPAKSAKQSRVAASPGEAGQSAAVQAKGDNEVESLPDEERIQALFTANLAFSSLPDCLRVKGFLDGLSAHPPQVLLLEGGDVALRLAAADYWGMLLNCTGGSGAAALPGLEIQAAKPCRKCACCRGVIARMHRDVFFFDGTAQSIKIDEVRSLLPFLGEPPRESAKRIVVFAEAQSLGEAAANALLKSLEEPKPHTCFVLTAPQRERLLPTLVSRSFVLTLPWSMSKEGRDDELAPWHAALYSFATEGTAWFSRTSSRGAVDAKLAENICSLCDRALSSAILSRQTRRRPPQGLPELFSRQPESALRFINEALAECRESLFYGVNPAVVLDWLATRIFLITRSLPAG